jgi:hypothetical protein
MDDPDRVAAWEEVYAVLPRGWAVMSPQSREVDHLWVIYARHVTGLEQGGGPWHEAYGETEAVALRALAQQFRNRRT